MESMYHDMLERRKTLVQKESGIYQFEGDDRFTVLYYNQQRDALFAKAKIPPFGDGQVPYVLPAEPVQFPLPPTPLNYTLNDWMNTWPSMFRELWKSWNRKREDLDKQYLEACGIILTMLGPEPLTYVQQYMRTVDGNRKFLQISEAIRRKYYPNTNLEKEIILEWISKSTDEFGVKVWFSLWQEAIDILELVDPNSIPRNNEFIRYMETGMSNREFKSIFGTLKAGMIPNRQGVMRLRRWKEIRDELLLVLDRDPSIEAHLRNQPKGMVSSTGGIKAMATQVTFPPGSCYNCGEKGHMMRECRAKTCSRCGNSWPSETSEGFHRCYERNKCPQVALNKGQSGGAKTTSNAGLSSKKKPGNVTSVQSSGGEVTKKQYKAHFKDGKSEGFKAALAMVKAGKSVAELEASALGKHSRST